MHQPVQVLDVTSLSASEAVFTVARDLGTFTREDLVVALFRADPERFSLASYPGIFPDSNKALLPLWGRNGLIARKRIKRLSDGRFKVTG
jgi:hypothetical protein